MGVTIKTSPNSFVQFDDTPNYVHPVFGEVTGCLPIYAENDASFQFILEADTKEEADILAAIGNTDVKVGLCDLQAEEIIVFVDQPDRFRISERQLLYNWTKGFPGMLANIEIGECFLVQVSATEETFESSTCFQRIPSDDFTSVIEYGNEDNGFGFNYCASGVIDPDQTVDCDPTEITFQNEATLSIPYTAQLKAAYGNTPTVQVWIYDETGELINAGISAKLDGVPPTKLMFDFGGIASGLIVIK